MEFIAAAAAQAAEDAQDSEAHDDSDVEAGASSAEEVELEAEDEEDPPGEDDGQPAEAQPPQVWAGGIELQQQVAWGWLRHQHARGHGLFAKNFR